MKAYWTELVKQAVSKWDTPFYLSTWQPVQNALEELKVLSTDLPIRHWLSFKTHPVAPLIRKWRDTQRGVEVVSEYEFLASLKEGFKPERIIVNGVAKHKWLSRYDIKGIWVHFDSLNEVRQLTKQAKACEWHVGIRCHVAEEYDPDEPQFGGQFGITADEIGVAIEKLNKARITVESIHFHLRSNVSSANSYRLALKEIADICRTIDFWPLYVDCGGGLPVPGEHPTGENRISINLLSFKETLSNVKKDIPSVREIWLENGRFITARSAVLVVRIVDIKDRLDSRYLICDGGRTNHALVSDWEEHDIFTLPKREGVKILTTVCGPTCMAFDRLIRMNLPKDIQIGDYIVWMNAGAYHIPWETRFSHGFAKVIWCDDKGELSLARDSESFSKWWEHWQERE